MNTTDQLRMLVFASLLAALTAVGAYLAIPIGPVPIVLQNMFVFLAGLVLGSRWALASVGVYLLTGALGLPVFAGGLGGIGRIVGPTGGYLIGYLPAVFVIGHIAEKGAKRIGYDVLAMVCGTAVLYACGVTWLKILTGMTWSKTLTVGMYPFLIGDALKITAAALIAKALRPIIRLTRNVQSANHNPQPATRHEHYRN
jgi:biotin transport system substrate-specific component